MARLEPIIPPEDATLLSCHTDLYQFTYPAGGLFAEFHNDDGSHTLRLLLPYENRFLSFEIKRHPGAAETAQAAAARVYDDVSPLYDEDDNVPPFRLTIAGRPGWRCRKRFVDGFNAPLIIDTTFVKDNGTLYRIDFAATPEEYAARRWVYDNLLNSFTLNRPEV